MATKRIPLKRRRLGPEAEAAAWSDTFETSYDFFDELAPLGIVHPAEVWPPDARDWDGFDGTVRKAWHRLGAIYMANRDPAREVPPWALVQYGDPDGDQAHTH